MFHFGISLEVNKVFGRAQTTTNPWNYSNLYISLVGQKGRDRIRARSEVQCLNHSATLNFLHIVVT